MWPRPPIPARRGCGWHEAASPDAILLELHLPDLSGHDVLARLRGFTQAPVIMLSYHAADSDKIAALDAGAEDYVVKPFSTGELLARLRLALRRRHAAGSPAQILRWPGLDVDLARRRVAVNGKAVALTTKEWGLAGYAGAPSPGVS